MAIFLIFTEPSHVGTLKLCQKMPGKMLRELHRYNHSFRRKWSKCAYFSCLLTYWRLGHCFWSCTLSESYYGLKFCINLYLTKLKLNFKWKINIGRGSGHGGLNGQNSQKMAHNGQKLKLLLSNLPKAIFFYFGLK